MTSKRESSHRPDLKAIVITTVCLWIAAAFSLPTGAFAACTCEGMVLEIVAEESRVFCGGDDGEPDFLDAPGCHPISEEPGTNGCPEDKFAYQCPLGRFNPQEGAEDLVMGWTFQTVITVGEESTASECITGQYVAGIPTINGEPVNTVAAMAPPAGANNLGGELVVTGLASPNNVPALPDPLDRQDPTMGADGYTGTEEIDTLRMRVLPDDHQILLIDAPHDQIDNIADTLEQNLFFVTWVKPTEGGTSCWCRFSLAQTWENEEPGGPGIVMVGDNNRCALAAE